jgi:hemoglobin-like flavoprotein
MGNRQAKSDTSNSDANTQGDSDTNDSRVAERDDPFGRAEHARLVREIWTSVVHNELLALGYDFYKALFTTYPAWRLTLFGGVDPHEQPQLLMEMMNRAVELFLEKSGDAEPDDGVATSLYALGVRHAGYGITEKDYTLLGKCFIDSVERLFADSPGKFTASHRQAFTRLYGFIVQNMMRGHRGCKGVFLAQRWAERLAIVDMSRLSKGWRSLTEVCGLAPVDILVTLRSRVYGVVAPPSVSSCCVYSKEMEKFIWVIERMHKHHSAEQQQPTMRVEVPGGEESPVATTAFSRFTTGVERDVAAFFSFAASPSTQQLQAAAAGTDSTALDRFHRYTIELEAFLVQCTPGDCVLHDTWHRRFLWLMEVAAKVAHPEEYQI